MLKTRVLSAAILFLFTFPIYSFAGSNRFLRDDGLTRTPFSLDCGSQAAMSPWDFTTNRVSTGVLNFINMVVVNPSENFILMKGTWSGFDVTQRWLPILGSSSPWTTYNSDKFWLRYVPGSSSETVRIEIEHN